MTARAVAEPEWLSTETVPTKEEGPVTSNDLEFAFKPDRVKPFSNVADFTTFNSSCNVTLPYISVIPVTFKVSFNSVAPITFNLAPSNESLITCKPTSVLLTSTDTLPDTLTPLANVPTPVTFAPPERTTKPPAVTSTPPAVTLTPPAVTLTPPAVTLTPPKETLTPPEVTLTPLANVPIPVTFDPPDTTVKPPVTFAPWPKVPIPDTFKLPDETAKLPDETVTSSLNSDVLTTSKPPFETLTLFLNNESPVTSKPPFNVDLPVTVNVLAALTDPLNCAVLVKVNPDLPVMSPLHVDDPSTRRVPERIELFTTCNPVLVLTLGTETVPISTLPAPVTSNTPPEKDEPCCMLTAPSTVNPPTTCKSLPILTPFTMLNPTCESEPTVSDPLKVTNPPTFKVPNNAELLSTFNPTSETEIALAPEPIEAEPLLPLKCDNSITVRFPPKEELYPAKTLNSRKFVSVVTSRRCSVA